MMNRPQTRRAAALRALMMARAVLVLALGLGFLVADAQRPVLGNLMAVFWLTGALLTLRWVREHRGQPRSITAAVAGVVGVIAAVIGFARLFISDRLDADAALALLGAAAIAIGVLRLLGGFPGEEDVGYMHSRRLLLGLSEVGIGVIWVLVDDVTRTTRIAVGVWAIVGGSVMLVDSLDLRRRRMGGGT